MTRLAQELLVVATVATFALVLTPVWRSFTLPVAATAFAVSVVAVTLAVDWMLDRWGRSAGE